MNDNNDNDMAGWRLLAIGEMMQPGDEWYSVEFGIWLAVISEFGERVEPSVTYRRRVEVKP